MTDEKIKELEKRIEHLEKLINKLMVGPATTYEPAPYWQNPSWKPPVIT